MFEHDRQTTRQEFRALTLSALAPRRGELLWDVGSGSGAIAIEWMRADASLRAITIERRPGRAARIRRNAVMLGVPGLEVIEGEAPAALEGLPGPDAIFIGHGAIAALDVALSRLRSHGRLIANAATREAESVLLVRYATLGGELTRIAIARADRIGGDNERDGAAPCASPPPDAGDSDAAGLRETEAPSDWRPALTVTQWRWIRP